MSTDCHTQLVDDTPGAAAGQSRPGGRVPDDALLDAARECVLGRGVRRTTLTQIARTAGVSRMTLYRRYPDVTSALAALMTREFGEVLRGIRAADAAAGKPAARARLVRGTVDAVRALIAHPLLRAVLDKDADVVLPYIVDRLGATQRHAETFIAEMIDAGHADGSIRAAEPHAQTRAVLLMAQSFTLSMRPASTDVLPERLLSELEHALESTLHPKKETR